MEIQQVQRCWHLVIHCVSSGKCQVPSLQLQQDVFFNLEKMHVSIKTKLWYRQCASEGLVSVLLACHRIPEMVRLGKMEATHASIKAYHIDFVSGRATKEESKLASAEGMKAEIYPILEKTHCPSQYLGGA